MGLLIMCLGIPAVIIAAAEYFFAGKSDNIRLAVRLSAAVLSMLFCLVPVLFLYADSTAGGAEEIVYPLEGSISGYNPYVQQFDAFKKGQTWIDYEADPKLAELENVYDYTERKNSGLYYLWDRAYYEGKYYSYFGIAPVLTVYYPYYAVNHALPQDSYVMAVFLMLAAVFMPLCIWQWAENFGRKTPLWLLFIAGPAVFWGSLIMLIGRGYTPFYYIASIAGCAFLSAFIFFALRAYSVTRLLPRCILWAIAGIFYGLVFQSRLNIAVMAAFVILPGLWFLIIKRKNLSEIKNTGNEEAARIIAELAALGVPVMLFFCGSMVFNSMRFSGPLDFGSAYQLTVADTSTYKLTLSDLPYAIYHYLFAQPSDSDVYPYLNFTYTKFNNYGHYVYVDAGLGLFSVPLMYTLLAAPAAGFSNKLEARTRAFMLFGSAGILAVALMNFCLGGVIYRYTCDMTLIGALMSVCLLLTLCNNYAERLSAKPYRAVSVAAYVLCAVFFVFSIYMCIRIFLINDNGNVVKFSDETVEKLQNLFKIAAPEAEE